MSRSQRNDPRRRHLHDYFLVDPTTGQDVAGFDSQSEAAAYAVEHLRGLVTVLQVIHPARCACRAGQLVYPGGLTAEAAV